MTRRKKIYEGKAKILYEGPEPGTLVQYFKDDTTAFDAQKKAVLEGKGVINNRISEHIMIKLNGIGVQNHFIRRLNLREQLIREVEIIPLEVVCRNVAAGSLSTRFGLPEGQALPRSIIEFYLKDDKLHDPMVAEEHITAFNWASTQEIDDMMALTLRVNDYLTGMFGAVGITLIDFKVEYGRVWENDFARIILADEISPDSCRLWDSTTNEKLDKDRFPPRPRQRHRELHRSGPPPRDHEGNADRHPGRPPLVKATVQVFLKPGVLDVQGKAVEQALHGLGWGGVSQVRVGRTIEFDLAAGDAAAAEAEVKAMCDKLLANTVIESYRVEVA